MSESNKRTFSSDFKQFFLRGLGVLLPSVLTLWIVVKAYQFVDNTIAEPINRGVRVAMINGSRVWQPLQRVFDPSEEDIAQARMELPQADRFERTDAQMRVELRTANIREWWDGHWYMDFIGLMIAIIAVYVAGRLLASFIGRRAYRKLEDLITSLPIFKQVYPYVKQVVDFFFADEPTMKFNRVVVCEYPRKGIWSVGFLTGDTLRTIADSAGDAVTIFIPSSPTPFTGYTITVPRSEIRELPISVEEAIRFAVSGGVLVPEHQSLNPEMPAVAGLKPAQATSPNDDSSQLARLAEEAVSPTEPDAGDSIRRDAG